ATQSGLIRPAEIAAVQQRRLFVRHLSVWISPAANHRRALAVSWKRLAAVRHIRAGDNALRHVLVACDRTSDPSAAQTFFLHGRYAHELSAQAGAAGKPPPPPPPLLAPWGRR